MGDFKIQGPVEVELKIHFTDGKQQGVATIGMGRGKFISDADLRARLAQFEREELPAGFRLMTKREFFDVLIPPVLVRDEDDDDAPPYRQRFAMPGGNDFDA